MKDINELELEHEANKEAEQRDVEFAHELVRRLNLLIDNAHVRDAVGRLMLERVPIDGETAKRHPTLQCHHEDNQDSVGVLGVLNGITGCLPSGYGLIHARIAKDNGEFIGFGVSEASP